MMEAKKARVGKERQKIITKSKMDKAKSKLRKVNDLIPILLFVAAF